MSRAALAPRSCPDTISLRQTMAKDREWLKQRLCTALGWDEVVVDGVVEAIASAESADDVDALVQVRINVTAGFFLFWPCRVIVKRFFFRIIWVEELSLSSLFRSLYVLKEKGLLHTAVR